LSEVDDSFLPEFISYLKENGLERSLGLEVLDQFPNDTSHPSMVELIFPGSTVMFDASHLTGWTPSRNTGCKFGIRGCTAFEVYGTTSKGHVAFNGGSPLPRLETLEDVIHELRNAGVEPRAKAHG
jgi:hypothetical protein